MASFSKITRKEDAIYQNKDGHLKRTLRVRDFLALVLVRLYQLQFYIAWRCSR